MGAEPVRLAHVAMATPVRTPYSYGRARRALAIFALVVSILGLGVVLVSPVPPAVVPPVQDAAGSIVSPSTLPQFCSACTSDGIGWVGADHSPIVSGPLNETRIDPQQIAASASEQPPDRRFGIVEAYAAPAVASYTGAGWERINFDWSSLEPNGPNSWNRAAVSGAMIAREIAAGREIVGIIGGLPHWAVDAHGLPAGLYLPPDDPRNLFGAFVAALTRRYVGRITHWIVWNEPDVWDPHVRGYTWPGTVNDFARLQKVAYVQIKRVDPHLVVHLAATTYWWDAAYGRPLYLKRLLDALAADPHARANNYYFDVASAHIYNVPDDVERILRIDRDLMRVHGFDKPIWLVETNATPTLDGPWTMLSPPWSATADEQAAYVAQASTLAIAAGAERISFYKMADPPHMSQRAYPAGLVRPDGSARPAIAALRATTHALAGWVRATDLSTHNAIRAVAVDRAANGATLVLWNTGPTPVVATVAVPVPAGAAANWTATSLTVVADNDTAQSPPLTLSGSNVIMHLTLQPGRCARDPRCTSRVGGAPLMVVAPTMPTVVGTQ